VVASFSASARVVSLGPPVDGVANLALTIDAEIVRANGARATVADIGPGITVEATGPRTGSDSLLTRRLVLV
jgi:hypothetical protein